VRQVTCLDRESDDIVTVIEMSNARRTPPGTPAVTPGTRGGRVLSGEAAPLGVHRVGDGVNVAVAAPNAEAVEICLFDARGRESRWTLPERDGGVWHGFLPGVVAGQRYGLRAHGPYYPEFGLRYNPAKLLIDPYARLLRGALRPHPAIFGFAAGDPYGTDADPHDSAGYVPVCEVVDGFPADAPDPAANRPRTSWPDTILYELHVKGFTRRHPALPPSMRGSYAGLAHPAVVEYLHRLGVTAVELLPVHAHTSEPELLQRGLTNYWGYNTLGFFAPHQGYAAGPDPVAEFRAMVWSLHEAGIEVILDVVYNHTAEMGERGPTLSLRGLDNATYYRLEPTDNRRYHDVTGCGNTLNTSSPHVVKMICDSLRYWVCEMGVDGFRFDLAAALARSPDTFDPTARLLTAIYADPVLSQVKLIAEPWDVGWGGYQVGAFPAPWSEWNGRFRDTARGIWNGRGGSAADLGYRLTGSSDLYEHAGRRPWASVNFVTSHDGFPLADLVSYDHKHNEANGEGNRDGEYDNRSANHGAEGPTDDPEILSRRRRVRRALVSTLLLSTGVPMLLAGDELGRSQAGNNNAYCQDNPTSWLHWPGMPRHDCPDAPVDPAGPDPVLFDLVAGMVALRQSVPTLRRRRFFHGGPSEAGHLADITWFRGDGEVMSPTDWHYPQVRTVVAHMPGGDPDQQAPDPTPARDDDLLIVLHPDVGDSEVTLPGAPWASRYDLLLDTAADDLAGFPATVDGPPARTLLAGAVLPTTGHAVLLLRAHRPGSNDQHPG
jgi:glycogen operon protein